MNAQIKHVPARDSDALFPITAAERETGISKELLRMWERRYGFPQPERDANGDRMYAADQLVRLRKIRNLIDIGFRPGKIIALPLEELDSLLQTHAQTRTDIAPELFAELLKVLKTHDTDQVRDYVAHKMIQLGLERFVLDFLQSAHYIIGESWNEGLISIDEEHLFIEQVQKTMRQAIGNLRETNRPPRMMLTTAPTERHSLGLLMLESLLRLQDCDAVFFGLEMPARDIAQAAVRHKMNIVALSFSAAFPSAKAIEFLEELRFRLPLSVEIWAGGSALSATRRSVEAVQIFKDLPGVLQAVAAWRKTREKPSMPLAGH